MSPFFRRTVEYKKYLSFFCWFGFVWVIFLLYAGGFTTSIKAGMAFLDWPLSNGSLNPEGWLDQADQTAEHGHRLLGMKVGLITIIICLWVQFREERRWVRWLGIVLFLGVLLQGILGGLRVKLDQLNILSDHNMIAQSFAVMHALGGQFVLCIFFTLAFSLSRYWVEFNASDAIKVPHGIHRIWFIIFLCVIVQLLSGAIMRHWDAGLAIPTFPFTPEGTLIPKEFNFKIAIHFIHRVGAFVLFIFVMIGSIMTAKINDRPRLWKINIGVIHCLLLLQIILGILILKTYKNPYVATLHVLFGAFFLVSVWSLNLQLIFHSMCNAYQLKKN